MHAPLPVIVMIPTNYRGKFGVAIVIAILVLAGCQMVFLLPNFSNYSRLGPQQEMRSPSIIESLQTSQHEAALLTTVSVQNARVEMLKQQVADLEKKLAIASANAPTSPSNANCQQEVADLEKKLAIASANAPTSPSNANCPFFGGNVLPNTENRPLAVYHNPGTRDDWIANLAKSIAPGSAVLDMSSGERPYQKLFDHCKYYSHEFNGNKEIEDTLRGLGANKANRKYDYVGERFKIHDRFRLALRLTCFGR